MENLRIKPLDDVAAAIADCRTHINELATELKGLKTTALRLLHKHDKDIWTHGGVTLSVVPGEEDLRVKLTKVVGESQDEDAGEGEADAFEGAEQAEG